MGKMNLLEDFETVAFADGRRRRRPFTDAVHGENCGLVEWRRVEGGRGVAQMMLGE